MLFIYKILLFLFFLISFSSKHFSLFLLRLQEMENVFAIGHFRRCVAFESRKHSHARILESKQSMDRFWLKIKRAISSGKRNSPVQFSGAELSKAKLIFTLLSMVTGIVVAELA